MLYTAFILGLLGSVHCLAMCGPLILAFGQTNKSFWLKMIQQAGRIIGYTALGGLMGLIGQSVALFEFEQKLSLVIGAIIILSTFVSLFKSKAFGFLDGQWLSKLQTLAFKNTKHIALRFFTLGIINSLLPCGLLFLALGGSIALVDVNQSMLYMMLFGLGTLPSMVMVLLFGNTLITRFKGIQDKLIPSLSLVVGIMMFMRGLGLGIPYLSPKINPKTQTPECCKHKTESCEVK